MTKDDAAITNTIITLAKNLNLDVIAEGVETKEQVEFLSARNCYLMQGYFSAVLWQLKTSKNFLNREIN